MIMCAGELSVRVQMLGSAPYNAFYNEDILDRQSKLSNFVRAAGKRAWNPMILKIVYWRTLRKGLANTARSAMP